MMKLNHLSTFNKASIALIAGLSLMSLAIPYAMAEAPADADFKKLDINSDKKISLKEAVKDKILVASFDMADLNKDGNITPDEYASYKASTMTGTESAAPASAPPPVTP